MRESKTQSTFFVFFLPFFLIFLLCQVGFAQPRIAEFAFPENATASKRRVDIYLKTDPEWLAQMNAAEKLEKLQAKFAILDTLEKTVAEEVLQVVPHASELYSVSFQLNPGIYKLLVELGNSLIDSVFAARSEYTKVR